VRQALEGGYLINLEEKKGKALKLKVGDPLPEEVDLLPTATDLERALDEGCTVAVASEGVKHPPSPPPEFDEYGDRVPF